MKNNVYYGTTNNKKKWCFKPLFVLLLIFTCFFSSFSVYNVSAQSSSDNVTLVDGSMVRIKSDNSVRSYYINSGRVFFDCSYTVCLKDSTINSSDSYYFLLENKPDISLDGMILNKKINGIVYVYKFDFLDFEKFTYCDNLDSATTYNYVLHSYTFLGREYMYVHFLLPFDFVLSYDYDSSINHALIGGLSESVTGSYSDILYVLNTYYHSGLTISDCSALNVKSTTSFSPCFRTYDGTYVTINYCSFSVPSYEVMFYDYDNTLISSQSVEIDKYVEIPSVNDRVGYDFIGWTSSIDGVGVTTPIRSNVSFVATYKIKTFNVVYKDYDGSLISSQTVNYGSSSTTPSNPSRVGYTFNCWSSNIAGVDINSSITQNVEFTATYNINQYNVKFIGYDGLVLSDFTCDYGSYINAPSVPSVLGYTFSSWISNNDNISINSPITDNVVFTANYSKNIYVVSFYDDNNILISSVSIEHGSVLNSAIIPNTDKIGYRFIGWSSSIESININSQILFNVDFTTTYEIIPEFWEGVDYAKDENYQNGYDDGVASVDTSSIYNSGYDVGYDNGYHNGYKIGESKGLNSEEKSFANLVYSIIDAPFNVLSNAFNFDILGVNLSYFLIAIVSLLLVFFVIRKLL